MRIGSFLGVALIVNPFFVLLLLLTALFGRIVPMLLVFSLVLWHETAHTLAAVYYGLRVSEIELLPFGGVARIDDLLQLDPSIEAVVAAAGPASNLILLGVIWLVNRYYSVDPEWFSFLIQANAGMAMINLLPALPLDGGRILRSKLMKKFGFRTATKKAASIGQIIAVLLICLGLVGFVLFDYFKALIFVILGFFVYISAQKEKNNAVYVFMRYLTLKKREVRLKRVMLTKELIATSETSVGEVLRHFSPSYYHLVWILDPEGELIGVITEFEIINGLLENGIHDKINKLVKHRI